MPLPERPVTPAGAILILMLGLVAGCGADAPPAEPVAGPPPSILWVVWDTVRADRLGVLGHDRPTTPHLDAWATDARVYTDCLSASCWTVPAHASMFTGLFPGEHGASHASPRLHPGHTTLAELLSAAGYQTYLFSSNPFVSRDHQLAQGFQVEEHPYDPANLAAARQLLDQLLREGDRTTELPAVVRQGGFDPWTTKSSGPLARRGLQRFLDRREPGKPFFALLNYMEAHRPRLPPRELRQRVMEPAEVARSYQVDQSYAAWWSYCLGRRDYSDEELRVIQGTYDASLAELDQLFQGILEDLTARGLAEDTVVIVTSDHGEHLGEHHLSDHQYSLYRDLLHVPLIIRAPGRLAPGRDDQPVMNLDLFPTVLALAGLEPPVGTHGENLLQDVRREARLAEYLAACPHPLQGLQRNDPTFDPTPWQRQLRSLERAPYKLIWRSDGSHQLFDLSAAGEHENLIAELPDVAQQLQDELDALLARLRPPRPAVEAEALTPEQEERLRTLGYLEPPEEEEPPAGDEESDSSG